MDNNENMQNMENNNNMNMGNSGTKKKNNSMVVIVILLIIVIIAVVIVKNKSKLVGPENVDISQTEAGLDNAVVSDDTKTITNNINNIEVDDTSSTDLMEVDKELQNL